jgi:hypothetical protein
MKAVLIALSLVLAACAANSSPEPDSDEGPVPTSPEGVVLQLLEALQAGEADRAGELTDPLQFPLLAIAEGVGPREIASLTPADFTVVASNFWSGFAAQLESTLGRGLAGVRVGDATRSEAGDSRFASVDLLLPDASTRRVVLRDTPVGWVIDLIASFPSPLLTRVPEAANVIRLSGDEGLRENMFGYEDSILFIFDDSTTEALLNQAAIAALEAIAR